MTDTEINKAIAEWCGWRLEESPAKGLWRIMHGLRLISTFHWYDFNGKIGSPTLESISNELPNYTHDLNACHEAENHLMKTDDMLFHEMNEVLHNEVVPPNERVWHCPARQRCEALLRTLGKWKE